MQQNVWMIHVYNVTWCNVNINFIITLFSNAQLDFASKLKIKV